MATRTRRSPEEARAQILDAAEEAVHEVGPAGLRVKDVAERAGMRHPTLLHHFGSREGLIAALTERSLARATEETVGALGDVLSASDEGRVAALADLFEVVNRGGYAKLVAWLSIGGQLDAIERPRLDGVVQLAHAVRGSSGDAGEFDLDDSRFMVLLTALALLGDAIAGDGLLEQLGFEDPAAGRAAFRKWFATWALSFDTSGAETP